MANIQRPLILIPSQLEFDYCAAQLESFRRDADIQLCGVGLIESAVATTRWIHRMQPSRIWLLGLAGCLSGELEVGKAYEFSKVDCYGIGVGEAIHHQPLHSLPWFKRLQPEQTQPISVNNSSPARLMLSTTAASASPTEAQRKRELFPMASAEDMESFSVALTCQACQTPLRIVRGISNLAGHRDFSKWQSEIAMQAALDYLAQNLV